MQTVSFPFGHQSGKDRDPALKTTRYPSYLDQIEFYNALPVKNQHAIRAMELAKKYKIDIVSIAKELNEPEPWIRKVLLAAITLSLMKGDQITDASKVVTIIGIAFDTARCLQAALLYHTMLCPVSPDMEQWMRDNLLDKELDLILKLVTAKKKDLIHLLKGEAPPPKANCFETLPDIYKDRLQDGLAMFHEILDDVRNHRFNRASAKQLLVYLNKILTMMNEIEDLLHEQGLL